MFIGKDGEFPQGVTTDLSKEKVEKSWLLILMPKQGNFLSNIEGLRCTIKHVQSIAVVLGENKESIHDKLVALGQEGVPAVLKVGEMSELCQVGTALSAYVCSCNFTLTVAPSRV